MGGKYNDLAIVNPKNIKKPMNIHIHKRVGKDP